jgi:hypothetical protein
VSVRALGHRAYWVAISIAVVGGGALIYWLAVARPLWVDEEMLALNVRDRWFSNGWSCARWAPASQRFVC